MRSPVSVSSRATMPALPRTATAMAWVRAACVPGEDSRPVLLQPGEIVGVAEQAVLGGLDVAGPELPRRQRGQHVDVGQHQARLMEGADQVLALRAC